MALAILLYSFGLTNSKSCLEIFGSSLFRAAVVELTGSDEAYAFWITGWFTTGFGIDFIMEGCYFICLFLAAGFAVGYTDAGA